MSKHCLGVSCHSTNERLPCRTTVCFALLSYPGREQQELFWRHYLHATHHGSDGRQAGSNAAPPERLQDDVLDRLVAEANVWSLAAHLYWGVWSIIQACYSPIDFNYMTYSGTRLSEFRRRRDGFLATAVQVFGSTP